MRSSTATDRRGGAQRVQEHGRGSLGGAALLLAVGIAIGWVVARATVPEVAPHRPSADSSRVPDPDSSPPDTSTPHEGSPASEPADPVPATFTDASWSEEDRLFVERALAEERARRAAAQILPGDSGRTIADRILAHDGDPSSVLESYERFRAPLRTHAGAPHRVEATEEKVRFSGNEPIPPVIEFAEGWHTLSRGFAVRDPMESIEIRGAGIDRTFIVLETALLNALASVESVWIHDLTVIGGGAPIKLAKSTAAWIENVAFLDWRSAGYSAAIGIGGRVYLGVKDCAFLAGPESGMFGISVRGESVALIEDCRFAGMSSAIAGSGESGTASGALLRNCVFDNTRLTDSRTTVRHGTNVGGLGFAIDVVGGAGSFGAVDLGPEEREKQFGLEYARSVTGLTLEPGFTAWSIGDVLTIHPDLASEWPDRTIGRIAFAGYALGDGVYVDAYPIGGNPARFLLEGGTVTTFATPPPRWSRSISRESDLDGCLSMPTLIEGCGLPLDTPVTAIDFRRGSPAQLQMFRQRGLPFARWDAQTGELLD